MHGNTSVTNELLSTTQVAQRANCDSSTVRRAVYKNELRVAFESASGRFFDPSAVDEWVAARNDDTPAHGIERPAVAS